MMVCLPVEESSSNADQPPVLPLRVHLIACLSFLQQRSSTNKETQSVNCSCCVQVTTGREDSSIVVVTYKEEMYKAKGIGAAEAHAIDHLQA
jgi:hypothetical protein